MVRRFQLPDFRWCDPAALSETAEVVAAPAPDKGNNIESFYFINGSREEEEDNGGSSSNIHLLPFNINTHVNTHVE